mmetsp:Transcript_103011/g.165948  ORF Transcript_103011/g.165948 Transcript_103011/m.165948 type:complete len:161 (+) Transcript_103011:202-684(+)
MPRRRGLAQYADAEGDDQKDGEEGGSGYGGVQRLTADALSRAAGSTFHPTSASTDFLMHVKDHCGPIQRSQAGSQAPSAWCPSVSAASMYGGSVQVSPKDQKALNEYLKMKTKLEQMGCWQNNGKKSIQSAFKQGKINQEQLDRYMAINLHSNSARHSPR